MQTMTKSQRKTYRQWRREIVPSPEMRTQVNISPLDGFATITIWLTKRSYESMSMTVRGRITSREKAMI